MFSFNSIVAILLSAVLMAALIFFVHRSGKDAGTNECRLAYEQARVQNERRQKNDQIQREKEVARELQTITGGDGPVAPVLLNTLERMRARTLAGSASDGAK